MANPHEIGMLGVLPIHTSKTSGWPAWGLEKKYRSHSLRNIYWLYHSLPIYHIYIYTVILMAKCGYWNAHHEHDVIYHNTCVLNVLINLFWCLNHKINEWIEMVGFSHVILMNKCLVKIHLHQKDVKERL